jgi:DNA-binding transcriptional ArsR family regulator
MLDIILNSEIAMKVMFHMIHYGEIYPSAVAKDYELTLSAVQKQFARFEEAGVLISKLVGRTRVYSFNKKSKTAVKFYDFVKVYYDGLSLKDKEKIFSERRRPRRAGKPVVGKNEN